MKVAVVHSYIAICALILLRTLGECTKGPYPPSCFKPKDSGSGEAKFVRYFYNSAKSKCESFLYGGQGGNLNNFRMLSDCQKECTNYCLLLAKVGPCEPAIPSFFFDTKVGTCNFFVYGGCEGNANRFKSITECRKTCPEINRRCLKPADLGTVMKYTVRWNFDAKKWKCAPFVYGGKGGNDNNFMNRKECIANCPIDDLCKLPPDMGPCEAAMKRWYFDFDLQKCTTFTYGGCGGNDNNFESELHCKLRCPKPSKCALPKAGEIDTKIRPKLEFERRFYYNLKQERCRFFEYSGRNGNDNNFKSEKECELNCPEMSRCAEPLDRGVGKTAMLKWYYHTNELKCRYFAYGGENGNRNRFDSKLECQNLCSGCNMGKDRGPCQGFFKKWYYDSFERTCKTFTYGGCKGNDNNHEDKKQCEERCG